MQQISRSLTIAGLLLLLACQEEPRPNPPPPEVEVAEVIQKDVPIYSDWVGTLDGFINARIRPRVTGNILSQQYKEGSFVRKGDLLFQIDPRPFQIALQQARARLAQALAAMDKTEIDVKRLTPLAQNKVVSQQELDNAVHAHLENKAAVAAAQAAVADAQLNLTFTKISAPIPGIAGIAQSQIGDLVDRSSLLTTISTVDPIRVNFSVSELEYLNYVKENPDVVKRPAREVHLELEMILADGSLYPNKGEFSVADREVDVRTGALRLQGVFPNPGNILRPGQFARIRAVTKFKKGALLVPQRAVQELLGIYQVAVLGPDNKISIRRVKVGERIGSLWIIEEGLKPGERVVVEGIQRVTQGMTVTPKPFTEKIETEPLSSNSGNS